MKFLSLILLFTMLLFARSSDKLEIPKCIKYKSIKKVVDNDWSYASKRIKMFIEHNSTKYIDNFMRLIDKPLVLKTDEECIYEQIIQRQEFLKDKNLTDLLPQPIENMDEYTQRVKKEVKYKIYSCKRSS